MSSFSFNSHKLDISTSNAPLHIKFALICLNKPKMPKWISYFCFILSSIQMLAMTIKSAYLALPDDTPSVSPVIRFLLKFFVVGDWIDNGNTASVWVGTSIITVYILKMLSLMVYIHLSLAIKWRVPRLIQYYWSVMHSLHALLIFFWIHTFCMEIIKHPAHYEEVHGIRMSLTALAYFNMIISCILALFFSMISLTYKTKDVLSSKTNILETKNVIFKIMIPILWKAAKDYQGAQILILVLILVNAILHDWIFIKNLPYYRIETLLLSSILQAIQTSLVLVCFVTKLVEAGGADIGVFTFQVVWIFLGPFAIKSYYNFTWRVLWYVFQCELKEEKNISYLVHKRFILLYFLKYRSLIHGGITKLRDADLLYQAKLANITLDSGLSFEELDRDKKTLVRRGKSLYLEMLAVQPKSHLAQINLAYFYSKFQNLYLVSNNLLEDAICKGPGYQAQISLNMLRFELQKKLMVQFSQIAEDEQMNEGLNVYNFIINHEHLEKVKNSIGKQAETQINFWKEFLARRPSMLNLLKISLRVNKQRTIVKKDWNNLSKIRAKSFLSPLAVYEKYSSLINNNPIEGEKCLKQLQEDYKKFAKFLKGSELDNQTIFSDKTVQITMSGLRSKLGIILDCSANIANFYGWQVNEMKDRPIVILMPPFYRQRHDSFLLDHFNTGQTKTLNTTGIVPVKRSNGYIHPTWIHVKVSPVMEKGIFYVGLLRPCKTNQRMVVVKQDGKIDDMSLGFAKDMNLEGREGQIECDILTLCPQFRQVNEAFNCIAEQIIEKTRPSSACLLHTAQKRVQETEVNLMTVTPGETDRPLMSTRKGLISVDFPSSRGLARGTTLQEATIEKLNNKGTAQHIYENFVSGGSTLVFYPANQAKPITYSVKVTNNIHGNEVIKYVLLEKVLEGGESADEKVKTESSDKGEAIFPSLNISNNEIKRRIPQVLSVLSPSRIGASTSPSIFDTEGGDLMLMSTSPRVKTDVKFEEEQENDDDGASLSISDEVQSDDSRDRKIILRNVMGENNGDNLEKEEKKKKEKTQFLSVRGIQQDQEKPSKEGKQKKLKQHILDLAIISSVQQTRESSVPSSSYLYRGKKAEQLMIQALKTEPTRKSAKVYTSLLIIFFLSLVGLLSSQSSNLNSGIQEVQDQVPMISAAFFRQYNMISGATQVRDLSAIIEGYVQLYDWQTDNWIFMTYLQEYIADLLKYNAQFYQGLAKLPVEIQDKFNRKNVGFYDYDEDRNRTLYSMEPFFESLQMIIERFTRCAYLQLPDNWEPDIDLSTHKFVNDNALNDLLIQSQYQTDQLTEYFDKSTNSTTMKTGLIMAGVVLACVIFILVSIRYLCLLASESRIFMTMIFRMRTKDCEAVQVILERFQDWLNSDLKSQDLPERQRFKKQDAAAKSNHNNSGRFRSASMSSLYRSQRLAFLKLFPTLFLFICWSLLYFFMTSNFIGDIQDSKKRMEASLLALNNQTIFVNELVSVALGNSTATIENKPHGSSLDESLQYLQETSVLVDWFRDRKGQLTPLQYKVLFGFPCEDFVPYLKEHYVDYIYAYESCFAVAKGTNSTGLVAINSQFYEIGLTILSMYEASSKSLEELGGIFALGVSMANDLVNSAEGFLKLLYTATYESFEDEVNSIKGRSLSLLISIILVTVIVIVITWYFAIKNIFKAQKIDWYILQVIPIQLIRSNKHLQQYLLNRSGRMLYGTKSFSS